MSAVCPTGTVRGAGGCNSSVFSKVSQGEGVKRGMPLGEALSSRKKASARGERFFPRRGLCSVHTGADRMQRNPKLNTAPGGKSPSGGAGGAAGLHPGSFHPAGKKFRKKA